jgi:hypothetical protein
MSDQRDIEGLVMLLWKMRNRSREQQAEAILAWLEGNGWTRTEEDRRRPKADAQPMHGPRNPAS